MKMCFFYKNFMIFVKNGSNFRIFTSKIASFGLDWTKIGQFSSKTIEKHDFCSDFIPLLVFSFISYALKSKLLGF